MVHKYQAELTPALNNKPSALRGYCTSKVTSQNHSIAAKEYELASYCPCEGTCVLSSLFALPLQRIVF